MTKRADTSGAGRNTGTIHERWSWLQFACAFFFFGLVVFLHVDRPLDGFWMHILKTLAVAGVCGFIAGRFGDDAWHRLLRFLR